MFAIAAHQAWWSLVFVAFAVVMAVLERPGARRGEILGMALAFGGTAGLGIGALALLSLGDLIDAYGCNPELVCPGTGHTLRIASFAAATLAALALGTCILLLRRPGRGRRALGGLHLLLFAVFGAAVAFGSAIGNALVEIAALTAATGALAMALDEPRPLRVALIAQIADLATFGTVWQLGAGERNPLGNWTMQTLFSGGVVDGGWIWEAAAVAGVLLILAKVGLIGFLIKATPHLGRYAPPVLLAATVVGAVGATANLLVILP